MPDRDEFAQAIARFKDGHPECYPLLYELLLGMLEGWHPVLLELAIDDRIDGSDTDVELSDAEVAWLARWRAAGG